MDGFTSTKPYMLRALHEWCTDNNLTPHLLVVVDSETRVPMAYVKEGEIVLNLSYAATKSLQIDNDAIVFSARFGGVSQNLFIPMHSVKGLFARENGEGMLFDMATGSVRADKSASTGSGAPSALGEQEKVSAKKPTLTIVK